MRLSKRTRTTFWVLGALCASGMAALAAQPSEGRGRHRGRDHGPMAILRELDLTDEQRSSVRQLFEQARETGAQRRLIEAKRALSEAVESGNADEGAVRELAYQVGIAEGDAAVERIQMRNQIRALLTSEQARKLDELEAERRDSREERQERLQRRRENRNPD